MKIGTRELVAKAQARAAARATYEDAIDRGKSAVLHEEVLRGIHMLSIANIPAGEGIEVRTQWVTTLTVIGSAGHLRIPVTVGDVYGRSPLAESDDLKTGGAALSGTLTVDAPDATVRLAGGPLEGGKATLVLNRPIDLVVDNWRPGPLLGTGADGRAVSLDLQPAAGADASLNIAILVDHSGSMGSRASSGDTALSKHDHIVAALGRLAARQSGDDAIDLWEFDNLVRHVGSGRLDTLVARLSRPSGGTEIGEALAKVIDESAADGILLITDGMSHALDVQRLARAGRRISVVLVGEDSLEANVGYLAALTGGDIFVSGGDLGGLLWAAVATLRGGRGTVDKETFRRAGMRVTVSHPSASRTGEESSSERAVAVAAASFLLPTLTEPLALALAEGEGLVSHLTSLVLVDEAGATQEDLPGQRPVALPLPASAQYATMDFRAAPAPAPASMLRRARHGLAEAEPLYSLAALASGIDWASDPAPLIAGDITRLTAALQASIEALARRSSVRQLAQPFGLSPLKLVIALLAFQAGEAGDRAAARVAHRLFGRASPERIRKAAALVGT